MSDFANTAPEALGIFWIVCIRVVVLEIDEFSPIIVLLLKVGPDVASRLHLDWW
jgi:hypothetical protein